MKKIASLFAVASLALAGSSLAFAQDAAPTLQVQGGNVMTSQGGEFVTARSGKALAAGERVMVTEGSSARVVYANGCVREFTEPGVYSVESTCVPVAARTGTGATGVDWGGAATITGLAVLASAVLANMDDVDALPISR